MGKPRLIILIRHAQSEGNRNRDIHQTVPDHRVKLTSEGWQQAYEAGRRLRGMLRADDTLHFFTSPYRRTRETTEGILATLTSDEPEPSPFKRKHIKVYEEPRLREQDFGNFQPCSAEMERMWQERADYGHFFYRIPNGESAADAYDRISGFNESLWRQFGEDDFASVCVLVTHGLMSRVFLMKWYHFSVEYFEDLRNVNHCEFLIMRKNDESGKYVLENKLRTWSALKRERAALKAEKGDEAKDKETNSKDSSTLQRALSSQAVSTTVEPRRRWGGCPNGCNHDKSFRIRSTLADLVKSDSIISDGPPGDHGEKGAVTNGNGVAKTVPAEPTHGILNPAFNGTASSHTITTGSQASTIVSRRPAAKRFQSDSKDNICATPEIVVPGPQIDVTKAREEIVSSPDGTPSFISVDDRLRNIVKSPVDHHPHLQLHIGRDGGGTYSGHNSVVHSDADSSEDEKHRRRLDKVQQECAVHSKIGLVPVSLPFRSLRSSGRDQSRMGRGARACRLGDHPHSSDGEHEADGEHEHDCSHGEEEEEDEEEDGGGLARTLTDEADDALLRKVEREEKSVQGSVY